MDYSVNILGIAGSLRKGSYNRSALRAAVKLVPPGGTREIFDLEGIPFFNEDHEKEFPPVAREFKSKVAAADAILIVTPGYNYSVPGVLKNAIDWASRPMVPAHGMQNRWGLWEPPSGCSGPPVRKIICVKCSSF